MQNVFSAKEAAVFIDRINNLKPDSKPLWGKMDVAKMLAHLNVTYEMVYDNIHKQPGMFMRFILKTLVKPKVVSETPYKPNNPTAPQFLIKSDKDFNAEKKRLVDYINKTQQLGPTYFNGRASHSFGKLNDTEWNNMFAKHLDHHLRQFGV